MIRPKARPASLTKSPLAPTKSIRPQPRVVSLPIDAEGYDPTLYRQKDRGGKINKKANGGMCRGMGAATKGGSYKG